ncbi:hypothetical protein [Caloranaerobacter ferrireducens]|uniref:hypothetical protein n=1 Tax=Caloranaerobacter ferrireducens TaxID=1323370 RepID=UPI00084D24BF|nr:hypothetical protein [Caloranaerobacter ferrireducens]
MSIKERAEILLSLLLVLSNVILLFLNFKNLKLIKEFSSPKPFLKPVGFVLDGFKPVISIKNFGAGHAVNVKVEVLVNVLDSDLNIKKNVWVKFNGCGVIPYIQGERNIVDFRYIGDKKVSKGNELKVSIEYESDSGAKGKIIWKYIERTEIGSEYELVDGR